MTTDQPRETEFGELLVKIIKKPYIPVSKEVLVHPSPTPNKPGQPHRLRQSKLSNHAYAEAREKWTKIIAERNLYPDSHGLSYDMFMKMLRDLYGCDDVRDPEMPITREAVNHLVHTGNPGIKSKAAATVQDYNLQFICCFTQEHSFAELKAVGEKVLAEYHNQKRTAKAVEPVKLSLDFSLHQNNIPREDLYMSHKDKITDDKESANNLRSLIYNKIQEKGSHYFLRSNIPLEEIFTLIADENPKFSKETLVYLPELLDISLEEFILLLTKDTDNPSAGF
ncbi:hypothetical protein MEN41_00315 [Dolichospermum sp. ST_con]|nr:hypothetical protein [Dolichospermum sp. ST_con]MDD1418796.1 hypothetical protein [Dolichospermum sp. ST_sed1]MDD1423939.1 hypothetical protein [Dolichospermum sp. ST_sed9]MDD1430400.1 hypothetical protein [Dolichospermum sp. ST_sed6]MDD1437547.1 hypothetical protein [Dolichospermum sp. ST_sed10]MDD1439732.1 hypothetical protein [Dolichospermum sp. ST_sed3]MDD1445674.1 hypothetical protein [Dolichospermum sp. ST_sed8]MDD1453966.1 hypothetical protein [Dolichospermum sp. ST_sed7]MDD145977